MALYERTWKIRRIKNGYGLYTRTRFTREWEKHPNSPFPHRMIAMRAAIHHLEKEMEYLLHAEFRLNRIQEASSAQYAGPTFTLRKVPYSRKKLT